MKTLFRIISLVIVLLSFPLYKALAQYSAEDDTALNQIKGEVTNLLTANQELQAQYQSLQKQLYMLQGKVIDQKTENKNVKKRSWHIKRAGQQQKRLAKTGGDDISNLESDILLKQSKNAYLNMQLIDMDEKEKLWKLQLADLQYQKRDLEMALRSKQFLHDEAKRKREAELIALKNKLRRSMEKEQEMKGLITETQHQSSTYPLELEKLQSAIAPLDDQIVELESKLKFQVRENANLKNKKFLATQVFENDIWQKESEKARIDKKVQELEAQYSALSETVKVSIDKQKEKRKLVDDIVKRDKENQQLRDKLSDLQSKIDSLRQ